MITSGQNERSESQLLWERMQNGDDQALAILFKRNYAMLYDYGIKMSHKEEIVKDCIQDVFAYIWKKRKNLSIVDSVQSYLMVALRRQVLKSLKQQQKRLDIYQEFSFDQPQNAFSAEELLVMNEGLEIENKILKQALNQIPTRMREALYLKTYSGLPYKKIAVIMQINSQVARNYVSEAFHRLRVILAEEAEVV